ncbi:MAG: radical SAM protein [Proteobacteria bacterium]|nr:radical SAM protein [Pseudomonadota bacterium]
MGIRKREDSIKSQYNKSRLKFDESTYHYSSEEKEREFIQSQFSTKDEMRRYQEYRKEWHRRSDEMDPGSFPLAVICELVSVCNLTCEMCYTRTPEFQKTIVGKQRMLPWDIVVQIIDECVELGVYSMLFSWRGESTLYHSKGSDGKWHDFADVLAYARHKKILEITSLTNGRVLKDLLIEKIVKAQPSWLSFSIDGFGDDYGKIRKSLKIEKMKRPFDIVVDNIKKMIEVRRVLGLTMPQIRTNTIYPPISNNPERYRLFMESIGVGLVTINEMLDYRGAELPEDAVMDDWFCQYPFQRLVVSANGMIMPCPGAHNEDDEVVIGRYVGIPYKNIVIEGVTKTIEYPEITLKKAWESEKVKRIRKVHREGKRKEIQVCKHCRHGAKKHGYAWIPDDWDMQEMRWKDRVWRNG